MIQAGLGITSHRVMTSIAVEGQNVLKWFFQRSTSLGQQVTVLDFTIKLAHLTFLGSARLRLLVLARTAGVCLARLAFGLAPSLVAGVAT